jgi:large subunit ribosomal protein L28
MSKVCQVTKKKPLVVNLVSHAKNRTKSRQMPNLQDRKIFIPELGRSVKLKVTARGLKTLQKQVNVLKYLREQGVNI